MAKYRRYRKYTRRGRSGRWCPNIKTLFEAVQVPAGTGRFFINYTLTSNPLPLQTTVSQVYTVKNFEVTFTVEPATASTAQYMENLCAYIMYVPQGMSVGDDYHEQHPEYIMAYKFLGSPTGISYAYASSGSNMFEGQQFQPQKIRTRLARKLQTGDQVILYISGVNTGSSAALNAELNGVLRWWTKAN